MQKAVGRGAAVGVWAGTWAGIAHAAVSPVVATVITEAVLVAGALTSLNVAVWGVKYVRKRFFSEDRVARSVRLDNEKYLKSYYVSGRYNRW